MSFLTTIKNAIKKQFVAGILVTLPLIATFLVLRFLFSTLDGILSPLVEKWLGREIPGLGAAVTIILIFIAGIITTNYLGAKIYRLGDRFLVRTPLVRIVYSAAKQFMESMVSPTAKAFSEVVLVEYPRKGVYAIGFLSSKAQIENKSDQQAMQMVFLPSTPTPFTGWVLLVPTNEIYHINLTVEEAVKLLVSGGIVTPTTIRMHRGPSLGDSTHAAG